MDTRPVTDGGTAIDPTDRAALRQHLDRFAGAAGVTERDDGTLLVEFSGSTYVSVDPAGRVTSGMPLHAFDGPADRLRFDHERGEVHVTAADSGMAYTFRRP